MLSKVLSLLFIINSFVSISQELDENQINSITQNIMMYRIHYLLEDSTLYCIDKDYYFKDYVLYSDEEYELDIFQIDSENYPDSSLKLFSIWNNHYAKRKIGADTRTTFMGSDTFGDDLFYSLEKRILIGIDSNTNGIVFFSGNVFKNCIQNNFQLDQENPDGFGQFLKFKLFNYQIEGITHIKTKKDYLLFNATSKLVGDDKLLIKVFKNDYDKIQVKLIGSGLTENGSYKWEEK